MARRGYREPSESMHLHRRHKKHTKLNIVKFVKSRRMARLGLRARRGRQDQTANLRLAGVKDHRAYRDRRAKRVIGFEIWKN